MVGEDKVDTTVYIPVEIVNLPKELIISNQFKKQLEATVRGPVPPLVEKGKGPRGRPGRGRRR